MTLAKKQAQSVIWQPNPGPQTSFLQATEFECLYGGAAGGGKTDAALFGGLRYIHVPDYKALFLRKTFPELAEVIDRSMVFRHLGGKWNEQKKRWRFPSGAVYEFGYFDRWEHHMRYQGQEYQYITWDELGACAEERFWTFLQSRCRSTNPNLRPMMRATANPGGSGHAWLKKRFVDICGEDGSRLYTDTKTKLQRRFIPARLADNPTLDLNDPSYRQRLESLPDVLRKQLLHGDWGAAVGMALEELQRNTHMVDVTPVPSHWGYFASFDWGFSHPAAYGIFAIGPEKQVILVDSLHLWRKTPLEIVERIDEKLEQLGNPPIRYTVAGRDCWADIKARGENVPTLAEQFAGWGHPLVRANTSRVAGLNNVRAYLTTRGLGKAAVEPKFTMFETRGNLHTLDILQGLVVDPKDREDSLKSDADEYGDGGDDPYDMVRYGLASRPIKSMTPKKKKVHDPNRDPTADDGLKNHPWQTGVRKRRYPWDP